MSIVPDIPPKLFSLSAVAVGYLLIDDLSANEQNALGNWLMLTAQVLCTNAYYKQVQTERQNASYQNNPNSSSSYSNNISVEMLTKMVEALNKEIQDLKAKI